MASLEIKLDLSDEDRALLDRLIEALTQASGVAKTNIVCHQHGDNSQHIDNVGTVNIDNTPKQEPEVTAAEIQAEVVRLISKNKKAEVKDIIKKYAARVSDIPEDKRADVLSELKALEG